MYTNKQPAVINNDHISEFFSLEKGVRQGCPLSASKTNPSWGWGLDGGTGLT